MFPKNGVVPVAPRGRIAMLSDYVAPDEDFVTCPNQDVVYGLGFFSLDEEPVVIQVPDFGDRFWVYAVYDARTDQFADLGKPYGTTPGFYLLAGPNWKGDVPAGIAGVFRGSTALANTVPRVFMNNTDEDRAAIQEVIDQIVAYPLSEFDGKMKSMDWSEAPTIPGPAATGGETKSREARKTIRNCQHGATASGSKVRARQAECQRLLDEAERLINLADTRLTLAEARQAAWAELERIETQLETAAANLAEILREEQEQAWQAAMDFDDAPAPEAITENLDDAMAAVAGSEKVATALKVRRPRLAQPLLDRAHVAKTRIDELRARLTALS